MIFKVQISDPTVAGKEFYILLKVVFTEHPSRTWLFVPEKQLTDTPDFIKLCKISVNMSISKK